MIATVLVVGLVLAQNYQGYPVAPRASGMGGAATAMGEGAGNSFYNPAAISFGSKMSGDVSGNVFAGSLTYTTNEFGVRRTMPRIGVQIIPSNMSFEWRGLKLGPIELSERWGLGFSLLAPFDLDLSTLVQSTDDASLVLVDSTERVYAIYNTVGYQLTDQLGIGISIVAMYRQATGTAVIDHFEQQLVESFIVRQTRKSISHGLAVGAQWKPSNGFRAGLSVRLPVSAVFGFGDDVGRGTVVTIDAANQATLGRAVVNRRVESRYERPWRFNLGVGWEKAEAWAVALDMSAFTPLEYIAERDVDTGATLAVTSLLPVLNLSVGGELYVGKVPLRVGFFTDHSPFAVDGTNSLGTPRINRYGGTFSFTIDRALFRTEIGLLLSGGAFTMTSLDVSAGELNNVRASGTELRGVITYSSTLKL